MIIFTSCYPKLQYSKDNFRMKYLTENLAVYSDQIYHNGIWEIRLQYKAKNLLSPSYRPILDEQKLCLMTLSIILICFKDNCCFINKLVEETINFERLRFKNFSVFLFILLILVEFVLALFYHFFPVT